MTKTEIKKQVDRVVGMFKGKSMGEAVSYMAGWMHGQLVHSADEESITNEELAHQIEGMKFGERETREKALKAFCNWSKETCKCAGFCVGRNCSEKEAFIKILDKEIK